MKIRVECYAGYRAEETPRKLFFGERQVTVVDILDRWLAPDHRYFKMLGDDGARYIVRHDVLSWQWEMVFFQSAKWDRSLSRHDFQEMDA